jgi:hypothetical protein
LRHRKALAGSFDHFPDLLSRHFHSIISMLPFGNIIAKNAEIKRIIPARELMAFPTSQKMKTSRSGTCLNAFRTKDLMV